MTQTSNRWLRRTAALAATTAMTSGLMAGTAPVASAAVVPYTIDTVAGNSGWQNGGDGGLATAASLGLPYDAVAVGNEYYIATQASIRRVGADGVITTIAGNGTYGYWGDGGAATSAGVCPTDLAHSGTALYFVDACGDRVRKIEAGVVTTVVGGGTQYPGDYAVATAVRIEPTALAYSNGRLYVADGLFESLFSVDSAGIVQQVATWFPCLAGIAASRDGVVYAAEPCNNRVLKFERSQPYRSVVQGSDGYAGDGGPAALASVWQPQDVAVDAVGNIYIADSGNYRVRVVDPAGVITTLAGDGQQGFAGDGGPAALARIGFAYGLSADAAGTVTLADSTNHRVRRIAAAPLAATNDAFASDGCDSGTVVAASTYGGVAVRVSAVTVDADTQWVCVRADGASVGVGGRFEVTGASVAGPGAPAVDDEAAACAAEPGNAVPGPHPAVTAELGDPSDPTTYLPVALDSFANDGAAWVCVQVGAARYRVVVPVAASVGEPTVGFTPDVAGPHQIAVPGPSATPSGSCQATPGSTRYVDTYSGATRAALYGVSPTPTKHQLCVRLQGPVTAGGVLTVDTTSALGTLPQVMTSTTDMAPCTTQVAQVGAPANVSLRRSAGTGPPASVCVTVGSESLRVTLGAGTGGQPVNVTWQPDPGTPGLP